MRVTRVINTVENAGVSTKLSGIVAGTVGGVLIISALVSCGASSHSSSTEPTVMSPGSPGSQQVIQMPYGFRNVAFTCFGHNGVYVTSRGVGTTPADLPSAVTVVQNDEHCK